MRTPPTLPEISHDSDPPPTASHAIDPSPSTPTLLYFRLAYCS